MHGGHLLLNGKSNEIRKFEAVEELNSWIITKAIYLGKIYESLSLMNLLLDVHCYGQNWADKKQKLNALKLQKKNDQNRAWFHSLHVLWA